MQNQQHLAPSRAFFLFALAALCCIMNAVLKNGDRVYIIEGLGDLGKLVSHLLNEIVQVSVYQEITV